MAHRGTNIDRSEHYGALQDLVDALFEGLEVADGAPGMVANPREGAAPTASSAATKNSAASLREGATPASSRTAEAFGVSERAASLLGLGALLNEPGAGEDDEVDAGPTVRRLDAVLAAEAADLPDDLMRIVKLLPPGDYTRERLCTQLNSALTGHAWGQVYGTVS